MAVWGTNFIVIKTALEHFPPLFLAALRYAFALIPAVFFLKRPNVSWRVLAAYGMLIGVGQFGVMFYALRGAISPGMASLLMQTQVFFTIGLAMALNRERLAAHHAAALALAAAGFAIVLTRGDFSATPLGVGLVLFAALCWAGGNTVARRAGVSDMLAFVVWSSLFAVPPLLALSLALEGWPAIAEGVRTANIASWAAAIWQAAGNTLFGYAAWGWLLARYPSAAVAPTALLVPVFGMASSSLLLQEPMPAWKLLAAGLVLAGLALNFIWPALRRPRAPG